MDDSAMGRGRGALSVHEAVEAKDGAKTNVEYMRFHLWRLDE